MERTQRLLSIALAVLALDACRGPEHVAGPQPTGSPGSSSHSSGHVYHSGAGGYIGGAAGAYAGRNRNARNRGYGTSRTLGGNRGGIGGWFHSWSHGGGFGHSGAFGHGG